MLISHCHKQYSASERKMLVFMNERTTPFHDFGMSLMPAILDASCCKQRAGECLKRPTSSHPQKSQPANLQDLVQFHFQLKSAESQQKPLAELRITEQINRNCPC